MEEERKEINKKTKIMLVIGVSILLVLVISATYAFFAVDATNNTTSTVITGKTEKVGNATLSTLVESLHINLSATDMAKTNAGKYYATKEDGKDYEPNKSLGYYDLAQLSLTSSDDAEDNNIYTCNTTLKITLDTAEQDSMISELQTGDVIFHTFVNGHNTDYDLSDIKETGSKEIEVEIESVGSNTKNIRGYLEFTNKKEDDQSKLSGKNLKVTIETKGLSCNVTGKAVEADSTKVKSFISDNNASASKLSFVDYIDESGEEGQDLSLAKDGSIKGWVNDSTIYIGSNKSKIMIRDMSNIFDLGYSTNYSVILDNLTFDRNTKLSYMLHSTMMVSEVKFPENIDTSKVTNMYHMFGSFQNIKNFDLNSFDTSNITDMSYMFTEQQYIENFHIDNFDTSKVTTMSKMFSCFVASGFDFLDLSNFDTSNVTDMSNMFEYIHDIKHIDLRSFDFSNANVTDIFQSTSGLEIIVKDEEQKGYIQEEAEKAGATIKIANQE